MVHLGTSVTTHMVFWLYMCLAVHMKNKSRAAHFTGLHFHHGHIWIDERQKGSHTHTHAHTHSHHIYTAQGHIIYSKPTLAFILLTVSVHSCERNHLSLGLVIWFPVGRTLHWACSMSGFICKTVACIWLWPVKNVPHLFSYFLRASSQNNVSLSILRCVNKSSNSCFCQCA